MTTELKEQHSPSYLADLVKRFLEGYEKKGETVYFDRIKALKINGSFVLKISFEDIITGVTTGNVVFTEHEREMIFDSINLNTGEFIEATKEAVVDIVGDSIADKDEFVSRLTIQINDAPEMIEISDRKPSIINKFIGIECVISRLDDNPSLLYRTIVYNCDNCGKKIEVESDGIKHTKPRKCSSCGEKEFTENDEETAKHVVNYKRMEVQQLPERIDPDAPIAASMEAWLIGDELVEKAIAGDRAKITGFIRARQKEERSAIKEYYLEVNYIQSINNMDLMEHKYDTQLKFMMNEENEDQVFEKVVNSVAPSVTGDNYKIVKVCLALLGVSSPARKKFDGSRVRGDINVLLAGEPGTAKSEFGKWMKRAYRRAVYVTNMSSKVGLTGRVEIGKNGESGRVWPGAYMLANGGLVVADELDKMPKEDLDALPNLMDDTQTLALNKGGVSREYHIRTSSLHICNPVGGKWDNEKSLSENIPNFAFWLFDRYDAKWVFRVIKDNALNEQISNSIIKQLFNSVSEKEYNAGKKPVTTGGDHYDIEFMREYFEYCRNNFNPEPQVSGDSLKKVEDMAAKMHNFYMGLKKSKYTEDITPREINVIFRWAMASARAHMRNYLKEKDFDIAIAIVTQSMYSCGIDPETGQFQPSQWYGYGNKGNNNTSQEDKQKKIEKKRTLKAIIARLSNNKQEYFMRDDLEVIASREMKVTRAEIIPYIEEFLRMNLLNVPLGMDKHLEMTQTLLEMNI